MKYVNKLVDDGLVYPCFCTDEELAEMKADAERKSLPPIYRYTHNSKDQHVTVIVQRCCNHKL